jgi:hypothetical protein
MAAFYTGAHPLVDVRGDKMAFSFRRYCNMKSDWMPRGKSSRAAPMAECVVGFRMQNLAWLKARNRARLQSEIGSQH